MTLSPQLAERVQQLLPQSGHRDANELLTAALYRWEQEQEWSDMDQKRLDVAIAEGLADLERGAVVDGEKAFQALQARIDQRVGR